MTYPGTSLPSPPSTPDGDHHAKPTPDRSDPLTMPFWIAASEGRLVIQQCQGCGEFYHPPVGLCWHCLSADLRFREMSGRGHIYSFVIVHDQRIPAFDSVLPYIVASVRLDDAPNVTLASNIPGTSIGDVRSGMPVVVEFEQLAPGIAIPQFRAADEEGDGIGG
jgi:uncharacterized OB-fold protein